MIGVYFAVMNSAVLTVNFYMGIFATDNLVPNNQELDHTKIVMQHVYVGLQHCIWNALLCVRGESEPGGSQRSAASGLQPCCEPVRSVTLLLGHVMLTQPCFIMIHASQLLSSRSLLVLR